MKPKLTQNKKGPRMKKGQFSTSVVTRELWQKFKKENPEYKDMTWDEFFQFWKELAETIRNEAIYNPLGVKLGSYTGELKYQYPPNNFKAKSYQPDEEGNRRPFLNIITRGKTGRIKWERRWAVKFNRMLQFFAFDPTRELNVMAQKRTLENPESVRMARSTLGGYSIWRQLKNRK